MDGASGAGSEGKDRAAWPPLTSEVEAERTRARELVLELQARALVMAARSRRRTERRWWDR